MILRKMFSDDEKIMSKSLKLAIILLIAFTLSVSITTLLVKISIKYEKEQREKYREIQKNGSCFNLWIKS